MVAMTELIVIVALTLYCLNAGFAVSELVHRQTEDGLSGAFLRGVGVLLVQLLFSYLGISILNKGFESYLVVMSLSCVVLFFVSLVLNLRRLKTNEHTKKYEKNQALWCLLAVASAVMIVAFFILYYEPATNGDFTVEITQSILATKNIQTNTWLTGLGNSALEREMTSHQLPAFYAFVCWVFGVEAYNLVWRGIPVFSLLIYTAIMGQWSRFFFTHDLESSTPRPSGTIKLSPIFLRSLLVVVSLMILLFMDYSYMAYGYRFLHAGWQTKTLFTHLGIPFLTLWVVSALQTSIQKRGKHVESTGA